MFAMLAFLLTALVIEMTPGPNMAYLTLVSAVDGRKAGFAATGGVALGLAIIGIAAAFGLAALLSASTAIFAILRWGGTLYLLWLAWEAWSVSREVSPGRTLEPNSTIAHFRRGLAINLLNPKAGIFFVAVLPRFVDSSLPLLSQTLSLTFIYVALATLVHLVLVAVASYASTWLARPERQKRVRRTFAFMLAGLALWFLFETRV